MRTNAALFARYLPLAIALGLSSVPVQAQVMAASYRGMSKSDAILGGAPSALAAIRAQQSGRSENLNRAVAPASPGALYRSAVANRSMLPVSNDRPDVFNSVALSIGRSPLDQRWHHVARAGVGGSAGAFAASLRDEAILTKLEAVNDYVNRRVRFIDDRIQFGMVDKWQAASETLDRGRGDCEDYAIAKRAMLRSAGVADRDLYLVVLKDLTRRADHAVLVVRAEGRFLVLDNGTDRIVDSSDLADYRPIVTFTAGGTYTHGYRRNAPPVTYASHSIEAPVVLANARFEPAFGDDEVPDVVRETASLIPATLTF